MAQTCRGDFSDRLCRFGIFKGSQRGIEVVKHLLFSPINTNFWVFTSSFFFGFFQEGKSNRSAKRPPFSFLPSVPPFPSFLPFLFLPPSSPFHREDCSPAYFAYPCQSARRMFQHVPTFLADSGRRGNCIWSLN